jgi:bifunctional UDP-N-acetylglucosamine pyrophosphorylase / glucosamine-1-phosphate N-acetyltransferase
MYKCAIILAAGEGKRMKSETPKVLHKVCGKEMVNHVVDVMRKSGLEDVNIVVGKAAEKVMEATKSRAVVYSLQEKQLGTGHAVMSAEKFLKDKKGIVAVFCGDTPLIKEETVQALLAMHEQGNYSAVVLTAMAEEPKGYGRIIRENDEVLKIVEHKDCSSEELNIKEINSGIYSFNIEELLEALASLTNNNAQGEYYLTDVIGILKTKGKKVGAMTTDFQDTLGVNSKVELSLAESIMRGRINRFHMEQGVTILDPNSTYIETAVEIEADVVVYPGNMLQGNSFIAGGTVLYPNNRIEDSRIGSNCTIQSSVILKSSVGNAVSVGPFAYIRPESVIGNSVKIGDFVEIKKSIIGDNTKVSHLTYIGDAEVGKDCNFGCGTVTVNYDGANKFKTIVGDNAFIGCNTNLVAPVEVKSNSYIAAGSTITDEVPEGALAIARARQVNKTGWKKKSKSK